MECNPGRWLMAMVLALAGTSLAAQASQGRMPRSPGALPPVPAQTLVIEGEWLFPCTSANDCFPFPDPPEWLALEVSAWVGQQQFHGEFDDAPSAQGTFEVVIDVTPQLRASMVVVEVLAEHADGHQVRFHAVQGFAGRLLAEAGSSGRLSRTGLRPNGVTELSTALTGLLDADGDDWRLGEARFLEALARVDPSRIMRHGALMRRILQGQLPGLGVVDVNALMASPEAVEAYLGSLPGGVPDLRVFDSRFGSPFQMPHHDALDLTLLPAAAPGTVAFGRRAGLRMRSGDPWAPGYRSLAEPGRRGGAQAMFLIGTQDRQPRTVRVIAFDDPAMEIDRIRYDCVGNGEVVARRTIRRSSWEMRRMAVVAGFEFLEAERPVGYRYEALDGGPLPCVGELPAGGLELTYHRARQVATSGRMGMALDRMAFAMQWLNPNPVLDEPDSHFIAGVVHLGTGRAEVPGYEPWAWVGLGADGLLTVQLRALPGSTREGTLEARIEPMHGDGVGAAEWLVSMRLSDSGDDQVRAIVTPAVRVDPGMRLVAQRLEGLWGSGVDLSQPGTTDVATLEFDSMLGAGVEWSPAGGRVPFSWTVDAGALVASSFAVDSDPGTLLPECPTGAPDCAEVRRRVWLPLREARAAGAPRLYVIEELWSDDGGGLKRTSRQLNFYDAL